MSPDTNGDLFNCFGALVILWTFFDQVQLAHHYVPILSTSVHLKILKTNNIHITGTVSFNCTVSLIQTEHAEHDLVTI